MIYISSSCINSDTIQNSVRTLALEGYRNIELSGGTKYYNDFIRDLSVLKEEFNLNYRVHNYFPPPERDFILNLASLDEKVFSSSFEHLKKSLNYTRKFGEKKFSFHAGFFVDRPVCELGKTFGQVDLYDKEMSINKFCNSFELLRQNFDDIKLYIENNCYSRSNFLNYGKNIPFMLLSFKDYQSLKKKINFNLLLDIGHLQVSAKTLGLDFERELNELFKESDYIHISNNDALHDQNLGVIKNSNLVKKIENLDWANKTVTLEVYEGLDALKETYNTISSFFV